ncbi:MAG: PDZ domain-containing protein [Candidatus Obscuribacterales bacterium]|nr:PDZ domain-containing protein [Candidatus Obscuribacterales bacterium]
MFAPRLPDGAKRPHLFWRGAQLSALLLGSFLLGLLCLIMQAANYFLVEVKASPQELYHNAWQAVRDNIYDQDRLKDWDLWEHKFDAEIKTDADALHYARQMTASLEDPYTGILDPGQTQASYERAKGKLVGIGVEIVQQDVDTLVISGVLRGSPAERNGLQSGDKIVGLNGNAIAQLSPKELNDTLEGEVGTSLTLQIMRNGQQTTASLTRAEVSIPVVTTAILPGNVGYLRIESFVQLDTDKQAAKAMEALAGCDSLILDMRGNLGGFLHSSLLTASLFLDEGLLATEKVRAPASGYITTDFRLTKNFLIVDANGLPIPVPRHQNASGQRPLVVLMDGNTASAGETLVSALQDNGRCTVVGSKSFGKGIGQTFVPIGNGARVRVTNFRGYTPKGAWLGDGAVKVANGIEPDIKVESNYNSLMVSNPKDDKQLQAALAHLEAKKSRP